MKYGANPNDVDRRGFNSLHHLCMTGATKVDADNIRMLCKHIDNINARDNNGHTAFYYLCEKHNVYAAKVLAALGCIIEYQNKNVRMFIKHLSHQNLIFFIFHIWKQCTNITELHASKMYKGYREYFDELQKIYDQPIYDGNHTTYFQFINLLTWERAKYLNDETVCATLENFENLEDKFPLYSRRIYQCYLDAKKIKNLKTEFYLIFQHKIPSEWANVLQEEILEYIIKKLDVTDMETFVKVFENVPKIERMIVDEIE